MDWKWKTALIAGALWFLVLALWWVSWRFERAIIKDMERDRYG